MVTGQSWGRGRAVHQKMFDHATMWRPALPMRCAPILTSAYFFPVAYVGNKALAYRNLQGSTVGRGVYFYMPCIPGQRYTTSAYVRQSSTNLGSPIQVSITGGYVNANPSFDSGTTGWTATGGSLLSTKMYTHGSAYAALLTPDGVTATVFAEDAKATVVGGTDYTASGWMFSPNGTGTDPCGVRVAWYDASNSLISTSTGTDEAALMAGTWTFFSNTFTAPSNAVSAGVQAVISTTPAASNVIYVDDVTLAPASGIIEPATVTAMFAWSRVSITYTATATQHTLTIATTTAPATTGHVFIDALQHEVGSSATAWSDTGPSITGIFGGFVERWPANWNYQGTYGMAQLTAVDAFAPMAARSLYSEYRNTLMTLSPDYYWPLSEPSGAVEFAEVSGNNGPSLSIITAPLSIAQTVSAGNTMDIPGDQGGTGVQFSGSDGTHGSYLVVGNTTTNQIALGNIVPSTSWGISAAIWVNTAEDSFTSGEFFLSLSYPYSAPKTTQFGMASPPAPQAAITLNSSSDLTGNFATSYADGVAHLWVYRAFQSGTNVTMEMYIDGSLIWQIIQDATTGYGAANLSSYVNSMLVGLVNATYAHVALWERALSTSEIQTLRNAGNLGYANELSSSRITRYLGYQYVARTSIESGLSVMGTSNLANNTTLLDACQSVTTTENGVLFASGQGIITFESRSHRYLQTTSIWTFGEDADSGEIPYIGDLSFDYDPTQVYNDVTVSNFGGINAHGGTASAVASSQLKYGRRSFQRSINVESNLEAQDAADWIFAGHADPVQRVDHITINPAANPSIWTAALSIRIGDRVTVKRRTTMFTMSADYFIERIEHSRAAGQWLVTFQMSPATGGSANLQPGILDDTTFSRLQTTGSTLAIAIGATDTSAVVATQSDPDNSTWVTPTNAVGAASFPIPATIDGEIVSVTNVTNFNDLFDRTVSNGFGTTTSGQAYTVSGTASDYAVAAGVGTQSNGTVNSLRTAVFDTGSTDFDFTVDTVLAIGTATGNSATQWVLGRYFDGSNYYIARLDLTTSATLNLVLAKRVLGVLTVGLGTGSVQVGSTHNGGETWRVRFSGTGHSLKAKAWQTTDPEPSSWQATATDPELTTGTSVGVGSRLETGNSNTLPVVFSFDNLQMVSPQTFTIVRPTDGTATGHAVNASVAVINPFILAY